MLGKKSCITCGVSQPLSREYFGSTPSGGFRGKCRKCMAAYAREYAKKNPGQQSDRNAQRVERGGHTVLDLTLKQRLLQRQNDFCLCCGQKIQTGDLTELDHLMPVARGGSHDSSNLALAHQQCNAEKHAKSLEEHWEWRRQRNLAVTKFRMLRSGFWEPA